MIRYIFFDMGSTLIDERISDDKRIAETLTQANAPDEQTFRREMERNYRKNLDGYKQALASFRLKKLMWDCGGERLYPDCAEVLASLREKYRLGIIANQSAGSEQRLEAFGIRQYFDVVAASAEMGFSKPDRRIFEAAMERAGCVASECVMVGDRLDNDIAPAAAVGMRTAWIRQGWGALGNMDLLERKPDFIVENLSDLLKYF